MTSEPLVNRISDTPMHWLSLAVLSTGMLGLGMVPAYGYLAVLMILVAGAYFVRLETVKRNWLFLLLFNQYFVVAIGLNFFHDEDWATNPNNPFYVIMMVSSVPLVALYTAARAQQRRVFCPLSLGLILSVGLLVWQFLGPSCRVAGYTFNPLGTAALLLLVGFLQLSLGYQLGGVCKILSWVLLGLVIYAILGPAGSRMPFFAGMIGVLLFSIYGLRVEGLKTSGLFLLTTLSVFALSMAVSLNFKDCGLKGRLNENLETVRLIFQSGDQVVIDDVKDVLPLQLPEAVSVAVISPVAESVAGLVEDEIVQEVAPTPLDQVNAMGMPSSEGQRFVLWLTALEQWKHQKLMGYGNSNEKSVLGLSGTGQPHAHSQMLSWLVSGGVLLLISGLVFVSSSIVRSENIILALLSLLPIAVSQLTDSLLNLHPMIVSISVALPSALMLRRSR